MSGNSSIGGTAQVVTSLSLILRIQEGDTTGWKRFVALYGQMIYGWCRQSGLQPSDAEDVSQEAFTSIATSIGSFSHRGVPGAFRGWLWTITRNKILDHFRNLDRRPGAVGGTDFRMRVESVPNLPEEVPQAELSQEQALLLRALEQLKGEFQEQTWQAFWRLTVERTTAAKIGEELGMTKKAVRQAKYRVIQRLREEFGDLLDLSGFSGIETDG